MERIMKTVVPDRTLSPETAKRWMSLRRYLKYKRHEDYDTTEKRNQLTLSWGLNLSEHGSTQKS